MADMQTIKRLNFSVYLALILAITAVIVTLFFPQKKQDNDYLFPSAVKVAQESIAINIDILGKPITLIQADSKKWLVAELQGYPADTDKVNHFIQQVQDLQVLDIVTSNPALYLKYQVEGASSAKASMGEANMANQVSFLDITGNSNISFIIGANAHKNKEDGSKDNIWYFRQTDSADVLLVKGELNTGLNALSWVDTDFLQFNPDEVIGLRFVDLVSSPQEVVDFTKSQEKEVRGKTQAVNKEQTGQTGQEEKTEPKQQQSNWTLTLNFTDKTGVTANKAVGIIRHLSNMTFDKVQRADSFEQDLQTIFKAELNFANREITVINFVKVGEKDIWLEVLSTNKKVNDLYSGWLYHFDWEQILNIMP